MSRTSQTRSAPAAALTAALAAAPAPAAARRARVHAGIALGLLLPALVAAEIAVLATETGSRCLTYGGCAPFPVASLTALLAAVAMAFGAVMAAPRRFQVPALGAQLLLEAVVVGLVLTHP